MRNFCPKGKPAPVVKKGEFSFAAISLEHIHIYSMCRRLIEAGAVLKSAYDPDPVKLEKFCQAFPGVSKALCEDEILADTDIKLVAGAAVTSERCALGLRVMSAGKDYFTDKAPLTTLEQLEAAKAKVLETGKKYAVCYSERVNVECATFAGELIEQGAIGKVLQVIGFGPHLLFGKLERPDWFFKKKKYGGILCDIGSHQIEQFLFYAGAKDAVVTSSQIANYNNPEYPELDDFGAANLTGDNGTTNYFRVDWLVPTCPVPNADGRQFILGTEGSIELRKHINIGYDTNPDHLFLSNRYETSHYNVKGQVGYPYFGQLILDCLNRTENAMTQEHAFKAAELCIKAQMQAVKIS